MGAMMGGGPGVTQDAIVGRLEETRVVINKVNDAFQDPALTTFVCVCIPEFLSIYETERLVQELSKFGIDTHNIVVNQVLFPEKDAEEIRMRRAHSRVSRCQRVGHTQALFDSR